MISKKIIIILVIVFSMRIGTVFAENSEGFFKYEIIEDGIVITNYFGDESIVTVPDFIAGKYVVAIENNVFKSDNIEEIIIPNTVLKVNETFDGCKNLIEIKNYSKTELNLNKPITVVSYADNYVSDELLQDNISKGEISEMNNQSTNDSNVGHNITEISSNQNGNISIIYDDGEIVCGVIKYKGNEIELVDADENVIEIAKDVKDKITEIAEENEFLVENDEDAEAAMSVHSSENLLVIGLSALAMVCIVCVLIKKTKK